VTRNRTPRELRDRMERVAAKRRQPPESASKRRTVPSPDAKDPVVGVAPARRADAASTRHSGDAVARQSGGVPVTPSTQNAARPGAHRAPEVRVAKPRSRIETLVAWGRWELIVVPARRWKWLSSVMRPGNSETDNRRRGD
jgi:hypothetical protein